MQNTEEHVEETHSESEGLIKTPRQLIITVILAFIVPIAIIILLVNLVSFTSSMGAGSSAQSSEAIAKRIQPVAGFKLVDADAPVESKTGDQVYESTCAACHSAGVAGAPKVGDEATWAPLIDSGFDELLKIAIEGVGAMPPRGGNSSLSDLEVARAVVYMANESGASFDEPADEAGDETGDETGNQDADDADADADNAEQSQADSTAADAEAQTDNEADKAQGDKSDNDVNDDNASDAKADSASDDTASDDNADSPNSDQAADTAELDPAGEKLYKSVCFTCHTTGVAGAPKLGDKEAWAPYTEAGIDTMLEKAIEGVGAMPPRGGSQASDEEMKASIEYILSTLE